MSDKNLFELNKNENLPLDAHKLKINKQVDITFDEKSKLVRKNLFLKLTDNLIWTCAAIILPIVNFGLYGVRYRGYKNIRAANKRGGGIVTIANHCMIMDSTMCACIMSPRQIYLPTVEETLKIPKIRFIVKALHAIPIPSNAKGLVHFSRTCDKLLNDGKVVHFFPEGSLWPWYKQLRPFKSGAFRFAVNTDSCILPIAITFRPRRGLWRLFGKKPLVNVTVLPPLTANKIYRPKKAMQDLSERAFASMSALIPAATVGDLTEE